MQLIRFSNYLQDHSAPMGFGITAKHPDWRKALIIQNGDAYEERLKDDFWILIKAYWRSRSKENEAAMRKSLTLMLQSGNTLTVLETSRQLVQMMGLSIVIA